MIKSFLMLMHVQLTLFSTFQRGIGAYQISCKKHAKKHIKVTRVYSDKYDTEKKHDIVAIESRLVQIGRNDEYSIPGSIKTF